MTYRQALVLFVAMLVQGCGSTSRPSAPPSEAKSPTTIANSPNPTRNSSIPVEVSYPIISDEEELTLSTKSALLKFALT